MVAHDREPLTAFNSRSLYHLEAPVRDGVFLKTIVSRRARRIRLRRSRQSSVFTDARRFTTDTETRDLELHADLDFDSVVTRIAAQKVLKSPKP
jgi:hypothetical protein